MSQTIVNPKKGYRLSARSKFAWRIAQACVWLVGASILYCLLFYPRTGLLLFWNILIPAAPALLVVFTGLWRNICPLATTNLLPRHMGLSKGKKLTAKQSGVLNLIGVTALFIIVPLRHVIFNTSGVATAALIITLVLAGIIPGLFYEWKSVWCSGLCPVHPVEKLYGGNVLMAVPNAHCTNCMNCVVPCPDSTVTTHPVSSGKTIYQKLSMFLITGGLPGFIWGWFQVHDEQNGGLNNLFAVVYKMPLIGLAFTLAVFLISYTFINRKFEKKLVNFFAAAGVSCYYWYRIPGLFGFGKSGTEGLLINLRGTLPLWSTELLAGAAGAFFFYWLVARKQNNKSWLLRPPFAIKIQRLKPGVTA